MESKIRVFSKSCFAMMLFFGIMFVMNMRVFAISVLPTDVSKPSEDCQFVGVEGGYSVDIEAALNLINKYRKEACTKGYINPSTGKKLTDSDYVPIQWSSDLEKQARIRAAEATLEEDHRRPNGKSCFSLKGYGDYSSSEVLAWPGTTMVNGISMWYSEKSAWVKQDKTAVTGHYTSMIDPSNRYVGLGCFAMNNYVPADIITSNFGSACCGRFSPYNSTGTARGKAVKNCIQKIEVLKSSLSGGKVIVQNEMTVGGTQHVAYSYAYNKDAGCRVLVLDPLTWKSKSKKITIDANGDVRAKTVGIHKVKFTYSGSKNGSVTKKILVRPKTTKITSAKKSKTRLTFKFKKTSGISGYQIAVSKGIWDKPKYYNIKKSMTKAKIKITSKKIKYIYSIRTYKKVKGKKIYSEWSEWKRK